MLTKLEAIIKPDFSIYILGYFPLKLQYTKTEISTFVISVYSRLVLTKVNRDLQDFTEI